MSNFKKLVAAALAATAALSATSIKPAAATPATLGFYPSTDIYSEGIFHFDADRYSTGEFDGTGVTDTAGLTYGLSDREGLFGRTEIGYDYFSNSGKDFGESLFFNAKTQLYNDSDKGIRAVGGLWLAGDTKNPLVSNTGYLLASKAFNFGRIGLGVAHAFSDDNLGPDADKTYLQLSYDRAINKQFTFVVDAYTGRSPISGIQPTIYYNFNSQGDFGIGYFFNNEARGASNANQLYLCFDYNFGGPKASPPSQGDPGAPGPGGAPDAQ